MTEGGEEVRIHRTHPDSRIVDEDVESAEARNRFVPAGLPAVLERY
jgi:hypothetical protein